MRASVDRRGTELPIARHIDTILAGSSSAKNRQWPRMSAHACAFIRGHWRSLRWNSALPVQGGPVAVAAGDGGSDAGVANQPGSGFRVIMS